MCKKFFGFGFGFAGFVVSNLLGNFQNCIWDDTKLIFREILKAANLLDNIPVKNNLSYLRCLISSLCCYFMSNSNN